FIGILIAVWAIGGMVVVPLYKAAMFVLFSPRLRANRRRAVAVTGAGLAAALALLFAFPFPYATIAEGVVWIPDDAAVRAKDAGVVTAMTSAPNTLVGAGVPLFSLDDPTLPAQAEIQAAQLAELK